MSYCDQCNTWIDSLEYGCDRCNKKELIDLRAKVAELEAELAEAKIIISETSQREGGKEQ